MFLKLFLLFGTRTVIRTKGERGSGKFYRRHWERDLTKQRGCCFFCLYRHFSTYISSSHLLLCWTYTTKVLNYSCVYWTHWFILYMNFKSIDIIPKRKFDLEKKISCNWSLEISAYISTGCKVESELFIKSVLKTIWYQRRVSDHDWMVMLRKIPRGGQLQKFDMQLYLNICWNP